jgi:hypothetical protein
MAGKTHYLEDALLNHLFRTTSFAQLGTVYIALFTAAPTDAYTSGSPTGTECTGTNYARASLDTTNSTWTLTAGSGVTAASVANTSTVTFSPNPGSGGWGLVTHFGIFDSLTTGNLLYWGSLTVSKTINSGDTVSFSAGSLVVSED